MQLNRTLVALVGTFTALVVAAAPGVPPAPAPSQSTADPESVNRTEVAPDGSAVITRYVPMPEALSDAARQWLSAPADPPRPPRTIAERRAAAAAHRDAEGEIARQRHPVDISHRRMADIPVTL